MLNRILKNYNVLTQSTISCLLMWFNTFPSTICAFGADGCSSLTVLPNPLPPDVANRMIFLPEKSYFSKNVLIIVGATYHQTGKPASVKSRTKKILNFFCTYSIKPLLIFKVQNSLLLLIFSLLPIEEASSFFTTGFLYYSFCLLHCISDKVLTLKHNLYIFVVVNEHLINYVGKYISVILLQHTILG